MEVNVSNKVLYQDESGRFMADVDGKAGRAVWELTRIMTAMAVNYAPFRTGELRSSIEGFMTGPLQGEVVARAPHALPQETGAVPHWIGEPGQTLVNPDASFGPVEAPVFHPGNPATNYMHRAFRMAREIAPDIFARFLG